MRKTQNWLNYNTEGFDLYFNYFLSEEGEEAVRLHVQEERGGGRGRPAALRAGGEGPALLAQNPGDNPYLDTNTAITISLCHHNISNNNLIMIITLGKKGNFATLSRHKENSPY